MENIRQEDNSEIEWQIQKFCTDIEDYEVTIEKQKASWHCEQKQESWKWIISYHGSIVASGSVNSSEEARGAAIDNLPAGIQ